MAELRKTVLGKVSGAVGDVVFRQKNGKNYVGVKPDSFIPGTDPDSIARRVRFALTIKFGQVINSIAQVKPFWQVETPAGLSAYNYIIKVNYPYVAVDDISDAAKLVPGYGFTITPRSSSFSSSSLQLTIDPVGTEWGIDLVKEPNIQMAAVLYFKTPIDQSNEAHFVSSAISAAQPTALDLPLTFDASLNAQQSVLFDQYQDHKAFVLLTTLDSDNLPVNHSSVIIL